MTIFKTIIDFFLIPSTDINYQFLIYIYLIGILLMIILGILHYLYNELMEGYWIIFAPFIFFLPWFLYMNNKSKKLIKNIDNNMINNENIKNKNDEEDEDIWRRERSNSITHDVLMETKRLILSTPLTVEEESEAESISLKNIKLNDDDFNINRPENAYCDSRMKLIFSHKKTMEYLGLYFKKWEYDEIAKRRRLFVQKNLDETALYLQIFLKKEYKNKMNIKNDNDQGLPNKGILIGTSGFRDLHINIKDDDEDKLKWGEFGIVIYEPYWKLGLGTEIHYHIIDYAFNQFNLDYIFFSTTKYNKPMINFYNKFNIKFWKIKNSNNIIWNTYKIEQNEWYNDIKLRFEEVLNIKKKIL